MEKTEKWETKSEVSKDRGAGRESFKEEKHLGGNKSCRIMLQVPKLRRN